MSEKGPEFDYLLGDGLSNDHNTESSFYLYLPPLCTAKNFEDECTPYGVKEYVQ